MRIIALAAAALLLAASAHAATAFSDVPRDHWAYDAIQRCVDTGILQGFDGKFHGKKLLNRYQMAVVVAKILDQVKGGMPAGASPKPTDIQNLEALTIEFADELALLNVKVSTLEDSFVELKHDVEKLKGTGPAVAARPAGGIGAGITGYADFALVMTDDAVGTTAVRTPYTLTNTDTQVFTVPLVSLAVNRDLGQGVQFNVRLNHESDLGGAAVTNLDYAYFKVDELLGSTVGGILGGNHSPFSMEHNGAFETCDYTITPSFLNYAWRTYHWYGVEFMPSKPAKDAIDWRLGILSGTDVAPIILGAPAGVGIFQAGGLVGGETGGLSGTLEDDESFGFYLMVKKPRAGRSLGWNFSYFANGGDTTATGTATPSDEVSMMQVGLDYAKDDLAVMLQYMVGKRQAAATTVEDDITDFFVLFNYKINTKQSISLRYEAYEYDPVTAGLASTEFAAITLGYNRLVTENSMLQFEYLTVDEDVVVGATDVNDDLIQLKYKVWF